MEAYKGSLLKINIHLLLFQKFNYLNIYKEVLKSSQIDLLSKCDQTSEFFNPFMAGLRTIHFPPK